MLSSVFWNLVGQPCDDDFDNADDDDGDDDYESRELEEAVGKFEEWSANLSSGEKRKPHPKEVQTFLWLMWSIFMREKYTNSLNHFQNCICFVCLFFLSVLWISVNCAAGSTTVRIYPGFSRFSDVFNLCRPLWFIFIHIHPIHLISNQPGKLESISQASYFPFFTHFFSISGLFPNFADTLFCCRRKRKCVLFQERSRV